MDIICKKIKDLRTSKNLTLKDLSEKTGLSISFLSQVERGSSSLAITSLKKIADAFEVPMNYFFESYENFSFLVRKEEQQPYHVESSKIEYINLSGKFSGRALEPMIVTYQKGYMKGEEFSHPGEEFFYVMQGSGVFTIGDLKLEVKVGDSIHFPSSIRHKVYNPNEEELKMLCVVIPAIY
jgi:transcriptional regulator with XRE-family HTH domain